MVSTAQMLTERGLQRTCGQPCVDWAIGLLEAGHDSILICQLAAHRAPHNHFELASLRDRILRELGLLDTSLGDAITMYATELLEAADSGQMDVDAALATIKDLCVANDHQPNIYDFYSLYYARAELREQGYQYYYADPDSLNIDVVTRQRVRKFLADQRNRRTTNPSTSSADDAVG